MKISVIIPCHNAGPWIGETLRSVAAQTLTLCEVILIDDASTDDSVAKANEALPGIRVIPTKFGNAASARNAGIEVATGDWIALLDADDVWYPNHLERAAGLLEGTRDVAFMANHHWLVEQGEGSSDTRRRGSPAVARDHGYVVGPVRRDPLRGVAFWTFDRTLSAGSAQRSWRVRSCSKTTARH